MPKRIAPPRQETPVADLYNLSDVTAGWLRAEGIETYADLKGRDREALWLILKGRYPQVSKLMYYALWGAVANRHWNQIPDDEKAKADALAALAKKRRS